jgi:hypothetical protein
VRAPERFGILKRGGLHGAITERIDVSALGPFFADRNNRRFRHGSSPARKRPLAKRFSAPLGFVDKNYAAQGETSAAKRGLGVRVRGDAACLSVRQ